MIKITTKSMSDTELDKLFGSHRRYEINTFLKTTDDIHYYLQNEENVLHISHLNLITLNHNSVLDKKNLIKISEEEFKYAMSAVIFNLSIYKFLDSKNLM